MDEKYKKRCLNKLKEWGAPLDGWKCIGVTNVDEENQGIRAECELCGCKDVKFVHSMWNANYFEIVEVGCVCAGIMEGDELKAKARDDWMKNRARRKENFIKKKWSVVENGIWKRRYRGKEIFIRQMQGEYFAIIDGVWAGKYKNFLAAVYGAFKTADPEDGWKEE